MAWNDKYTASIKGRRLGLQQMSTTQTGGSRGMNEFLIGPDAFRGEVTTSESTSTKLKCHGISQLYASSAGSSQVYDLDLPIAGVRKTIYNTTNATAYVDLGAAVVRSSVGSTQHIIALPAAGACIDLCGLTSGVWVTNATTASGINLTNST